MLLKRFATVALVCAAVATLVPVSALGHGPEKGRNGGQVVDAGSYHVEAVAKGEVVTVYLTDHDGDRPVTTNGFKGLAILLAGGKSLRIPLTSAGGNTLSGTASTPISGPVKGVIQITNEKNATVQAKF